MSFIPENIEGVEAVYGYIFCMSNESFRLPRKQSSNGLLKIGFTYKDPSVRADELFTEDLPLPYEIQFARKVKAPEVKLACIMSLLDDFECRVNKNSDLFDCELSQVRGLFNIISGIWYEKNAITNDSNRIETHEISSKSTWASHYNIFDGVAYSSPDDFVYEQDKKKCKKM